LLNLRDRFFDQLSKPRGREMTTNNNYIRSTWKSCFPIAGSFSSRLILFKLILWLGVFIGLALDVPILDTHGFWTLMLM